MRLRSIDPKYLDNIGLIALWREGLLAKKCIAFWQTGRTCGYINHSQLDRFKKLNYPSTAINAYLTKVYNESILRGMKFDRSKITLHPFELLQKITVTDCQILYEYNFLQEKLLKRNKEKYNSNKSSVGRYIDRDIFHVVEGPIEPWEKVKEF